MDSIYGGMTNLEKLVAKYLRELDLWWVYEFPVFVYDEKKRPRVWTPDFYIPKLGIYIEVCGSEDFDYEYRDKIYKKNGYHVIFLHSYKEREKWKNYLIVRIKEIEEFRHNEVMEMIDSLRQKVGIENEVKTDPQGTKVKVQVHSDGASRGNPGHSAIAFTIRSEDGKLQKKHSKYVGIRTNNQAEYEALVSALESASGFSSQEIVCFMDSELVVKHLTGEYQVRDSNLRTLWQKVRKLSQKFQKISFQYAPRSDPHIKEVDSLANQTLDALEH